MSASKTPSKVERRTGIALWRQIADAIRAGISSGLGDEDGKLPPEMELAQEYGVNRHTVRSAISALVSEGVLRAEQGRGTFIVERTRLTYPIGKRTRFSAGLEGQARQRSSHLLSAEKREASEEVAKALGLEKGALVWCVKSIGKGDDMPLSRATSWYDATRFPNFIEDFKRHQSITKAFAAGGVEDYVRQSTQVEAHHATLNDLDLMKLSPGAIVLLTLAINVDMDGTPIEYSKSRFAADRVKLQIQSDE